MTPLTPDMTRVSFQASRQFQDSAGMAPLQSAAVGEESGRDSQLSGGNDGEYLLNKL